MERLVLILEAWGYIDVEDLVKWQSGGRNEFLRIPYVPLPTGNILWCDWGEFNTTKDITMHVVSMNTENFEANAFNF